jgi:beta-galactosidase
MECGNHEDVRWAALTGKELPGLVAQADGSLLQASALPYTDEEMETPEYTIDLPESKASVLCLSHKTLGVGSNGCGPRPLEPYLVKSEPAVFSYVLRLVPAGEKDLSRQGRLLPPQNRVKPVVGRRDAEGQIVLACDTAAAKIEYSLDGSTWQTYSAPLEMKPAAVLSLRASAEGMLPYQGSLGIGPYNRRTKWKVISCSSFEPGEGEPANALDGDPDTFWHSRWSSHKAQPPHHLTIDFGQPLTVAGVVYMTRHDKNINGTVKDYEIYLSNDAKHFGKPAAQGTFAKGPREQTVKLDKLVKARYLKFVMLSEQAGQPFGCVAELDVIDGEE